jgi:hypothetical protein
MTRRVSPYIWRPSTPMLPSRRAPCSQLQRDEREPRPAPRAARPRARGCSAATRVARDGRASTAPLARWQAPPSKESANRASEPRSAPHAWQPRDLTRAPCSRSRRKPSQPPEPSRAMAATASDIDRPWRARRSAERANRRRTKRQREKGRASEPREKSERAARKERERARESERAERERESEAEPSASAQRDRACVFLDDLRRRNGAALVQEMEFCATYTRAPRQ